MVRLRTIGECAMQVGSSHVGPEAERLFATLLVLATERGRRVSRARLIALIWPDADERNGRHCLRQTIYKLRQLGAAVEVAGGDLELPASEVADGLDGLVTSCDFASADVPVDAPFEEWLPGYSPSFSRPLQEWVEKQRDYVHGQVRRALVTAIIERRAQNRWADVDALSRRCLALDPLNEEATLALAESAAMTGSKTTALRILDAYLAELGPRAGDIAMPAEVLRRRIAERLKQPRYVDPSEAYFVGRASVMAGFGSALQSARGGYGSAHLVWGPSGIGKSRLAAEVGKLAALQGFRIHQATCQSTDVGRPLSVFADAVPALRRLPGAAGIDPKSLKYLKRLSEYDEALADPPEDPYDSAVLFANVRRSIFDLFDAVTSEYSLLFVIDDAHWLDAMSWGVLRELMEGSRTHRLLILCTSRSPHATPAPPPDATRGLTVQRLDALDGIACDELIDAVTREGPRGTPDARLRDWTLTVAEGNPLFVRALIGHWMNGYPEYTLPPSLEALIEDRLNRLTPAAMRVLQACAVLGKQSTIDVIETVACLQGGELLDAIAVLDSECTISISPPFVLCKHEVLAIACLKRLGNGALTYFRLVSARAMEAHLLARYHPAVLWSCIELWLSVNERARALEVAKRAVGYLASVGMLNEAWGVYERLLESATMRAERIEILCEHYGVAREYWDWRTALRLAGQILAEKQQSASGAKTPSPTELLEMRWQLEDNSDQLRQDLVTLLRDPTTDTDSTLRIVRLTLAHADNLGDVELSRLAYERAQAIRERGDVTDSTFEEMELIFQASFGDIRRALHLAERVVATARLHGTASDKVRALRYAAMTKARAGAYESAIMLASDAESELRRAGQVRQRIICIAQLVECCLAARAIEDARGWCAVAVDLAYSLPDDLYRIRMNRISAQVFAAGGDTERARETWTLDFSSLREDPFPRRRIILAWYWLVTRNEAETSAISDADFAELSGLFNAERRRGLCDAFASAYVQLVGTRQGRAVGDVLWDKYLTERRELSPPRRVPWVDA